MDKGKLAFTIATSVISSACIASFTFTLSVVGTVQDGKYWREKEWPLEMKALLVEHSTMNDAIAVNGVDYQKLLEKVEKLERELWALKK